MGLGGQDPQLCVKMLSKVQLNVFGLLNKKLPLCVFIGQCLRAKPQKIVTQRRKFILKKKIATSENKSVSAER